LILTHLELKIALFFYRKLMEPTVIDVRWS